MLLFALLVACAPPIADTGDAEDTAGFDSAVVEGVDIPCGLEYPAGGDEGVWGAWLEGVVVVTPCDEEDAPCLSDGHVVEASWYQVSHDRWVDGFEDIFNDGSTTTPTRSFVNVAGESPNVDGCRITLF